MLDVTWGGVRGVDDDHDTAYRAALMAYEMVRGEAAAPQWRALLFLGTGDPELWAWLAPRLDFLQGHVRLDDATEPRGEPQRLLTLARHLFHGHPAQVNLVDVLHGLGDRNRALALGAMTEFCG